MTESSHAVVLGAGLAGMLTASVLARHVDRVTVLDRDSMPSGPEPRKGVPQARHAHLLWSGGARLIESLLPGTTERWLAAGARKVGVHQDMVSLTAYGWQHRFPQTQFMITCSRPLLDWIVRDQALRNDRITLLQRHEVDSLIGAGGRVVGARVRELASQTVRSLDAELVVDASGRGSQLGRLLTELGLPTPDEDVVDSGIAYATRIFQAPEGISDRFPLVSVYADHRDGSPGRNGVVLPIEDGRWMVTLSGTRGAEPPTDEEGFAEFAKTLRHPIVSELIASAQPLTPVHGSRSTANRRRYCERLTDWPDGLLVVGDALAALNPVYGHGMSAAARSATALDQVLGRRGLAPGAAGEAQRAIGAVVDDPWMYATSQDICYPGCLTEVDDPRLTTQAPERQRFADLLGSTAIREPVVSAAANKVVSLSAPSTSLEEPGVIAALRRGPQVPRLAEPPLSVEERQLLVSAVARSGQPVGALD
ncbi:MAG: FAD-dependent monooxygenase [Actinomycetota bacterium]|nr:FAD-dependent monooxygenase [Actinomycetota bacterium]